MQPIDTPRPSPASASKKTVLLLATGALLVTMLYVGSGAGAASPVAIPPPSPAVLAATAPNTGPVETVVFAGGCFWGVQAVFQHTKGVVNAVSGYAGGNAADANYSQVSGGNTDHAEAVHISFDPQQISYGQLLQIYFSVAHDPTQLNRQYPDTGKHYRSAVFYQNDQQKQATQRYMAELDAAKVYANRIVTEVHPLKAFYPAEHYHQNYATLHPTESYIARFDLPKLGHLKTMMPALYRDQPVLVK